jgi:pimeloyl-ACP methyl ester carboxylesterase
MGNYIGVFEPRPPQFGHWGSERSMSRGDKGNSIFVTAQDGLRLHVCQYGARIAPALPIVCLPGLARTVADFEMLAPALANGPPPRRVIAIDSRGRGQSDYDSNAENYNVGVELGDVVTILTALEIGPAIFVGSSRGGILTMLLGVLHPTALAGAVLHDIGPVIEPKGLARIKSYVGKLPQPRSLPEGAEILRRLFDAQFPKLTGEQWLAAAQRTWKTEDGELVPTYDVRLARTLAEFDIERPLPPLWNEFDALARVPILVIRGANSDILSDTTVTAMHNRDPDLESIEVADQGHVPLFDADVTARILAFAAKCEAAARRNPAVPSSDNEAFAEAPASKRRGQRWQ